MRYKTCSICGIVPEDHQCPYKKKKQYDKNSDADNFRKTNRWTKKSQEIRQRDKYLCQVCIRDKYNTISVLNFTDLEVHHIISLKDDYGKRLDNDNLITLCKYHHKLAEDGEIPKDYLLEITREQEEKK